MPPDPSTGATGCMPSYMAEVARSLRNDVGFHEGGDARITDSELAGILWENAYLLEGRAEAGIRTLDGQRGVRT